MEYLTQKIVKSKVYDEWTTPECLSFYTETTTTQYFDFSIHEKHGEKCLGDPGTWPVVDRFRVYRAGQNTHKILWRELANDQYLPFRQFVKQRKSKISK